MHVGVLERIGLKPKKMTKADRAWALVERCQQGDASAFRQLYDEYVGGVFRHVSLLIGPGPDVDDLVQLVFLNVFNSVDRFRGQSAFSTWLFRITVNVVRQEIRAKSRHRRLSSAAVDVQMVKESLPESTPEKTVAAGQEVYEILDTVSVKKRETFILYTYEGYSLEEIATLLDSSVSTIGSRLQSARREIMRALANRKKK